MLVQPDHLEITNLPPVLKQQAIEHLNSMLSQDLDADTQSEITAYKTTLESSLQQPFDQLRWQRFVNNISRRDAVRKNSHKDFLKY
jgi:hypothetical protein